MAQNVTQNVAKNLGFIPWKVDRTVYTNWEEFPSHS